MAAGLRWKFTNMAITLKRLVRNGPNLAGMISFGPRIGKFIKNFEFLNPIWPPAAILKNTKNAITRKRFDRLPPNFNPRFVSAPRRRCLGQKWNFEKSKMAAGLQLKFTNMAITLKRLDRNGPIFAGIILFGSSMWNFIKNLNLEIQDGHRPPFWKTLKTNMVVNIPKSYYKTANINVKN